MKRKFCLMIFNRATYSRCMALIEKMEECEEIELTLIIGSGLLDQEFGNGLKYIKSNHPDIEIIELAPNPRGEFGKAKSSIISGHLTTEIALHLQDREFDGVLVVADRFETLPAAMVASYMNFPVIHLQGGEVTGNIDERVRHAVTKIADYHFCCTRLSKKYICEMGEEPRRVFYTSCPSIDVIHKYKIKRWTPRKKYLVCVFHPDTESIQTQYDETKNVLEAVLDYCMRWGTKCHWYWPNPDPGREIITELLEAAHEKYERYLIKAVNTEPFDFLREIAGARLVVGNSSVGFREASAMGVPAINVGNRQSIRERSWNLVDCDPDYKDISEALEMQRKNKKYKVSHLYGDGTASLRILDHLLQINFSRKGHLTYPLSIKYMEDHCGESRLREHGKKTGNRPRR